MKYLLLLITILSASPFGLAQAQSNLEYNEQEALIILEPMFPDPETSFTASLDDYALPIPGTGVIWYIDGKELTEFANVRTITLQSKGEGVTTKIKAVVPLTSGGSVTVEKIVTPYYLDIIIEPQTKIPGFYLGRPLPSTGSVINATAILNGNMSGSNLLYTWRLNNTVLEGGPVRSKQTISFTMPQGQFATLSLEVRSKDGTPLARRIIDIINQLPELHYYEVSTLYGLKQRILLDNTPITGSSLTVRAEPYYLDLRTYNDPDHLEWRIDGKPVVNTGNNPYEITLASQGGEGSSVIDFHVRNTVQLLQGARDTFTVMY